MNAHVLIPVKRLESAKTRLAQALPPAERASLMRALLDHVLSVVRLADVAAVTIVSAERLSPNGIPRFDDRGLPWNDALAAAMHEAVTAPVAAVVSADLPRLTVEELQALVLATPERGLAIARARDGGTNAVSMRPPGGFPTCFGTPGSAAGHERIARDAGAEARTLDLPGLAFDVDTPEDLAEWRRQP